MAKRGESISAEFKFKVVLEALREETSLAEIASKYDVTSKSIQNWKKEFIDNGQSIFSKSKDLKKQKNALNEKDEYIEELHGTVGELTVQLNWLKKKSAQMELMSGIKK
ncbi:MAG TPA: transposase [Campylobacterales bacterium]|nr:transposase [Campylobacterales bacterium]